MATRTDPTQVLSEIVTILLTLSAADAQRVIKAAAEMIPEPPLCVLPSRPTPSPAR